MNVGQMIEYLGGYDEGEEIEVEVHFGEAGESYASSFDVTSFSHEEIEGGAKKPWPTIRVNAGFGSMSEAGLTLLIGHVKGIEKRLGYDGDGA